ncbi:hypothetical protein BDN72DRAFT_848336 [Pluteus cervinus]|uniref:Uncharacterized protein n=1 Tax=Pluteus cervinus TaxID=181527 RepID=A0ACD3ABT4_9AGAR|nr:hypothetical protein BDN72DRAFT_848336 [Pluteus cervinus]
MTEYRGQWATYNFSAISSLILSPERSIDTRWNNPRGLGKTKENLAGRQQQKTSKPKADVIGNGHTDTIDGTQDVESLMYSSITAEAREAYELILALVRSVLGSGYQALPQDVIQTVADTVLDLLRNVRLESCEKKKRIEVVVGSVTNEEFFQLVSLSQKIVQDYGRDGEKRR